MVQDFARLVIQMREAQKIREQYATSQIVEERAQRLEAQVDREALAVLSGRIERPDDLDVVRWEGEGGR